MFDILLYLYDNYLISDHFPDPQSLSRKLSAAGFEADDIDRALDWLSALETLTPATEVSEISGARVFSSFELDQIEADGLSFILFLENAGLLTASAREWVLDRAMSLEDTPVSADKIKWISLLAISRLQGAGDALWLEDLVRTGEDDWQPTLH